ncbi:MAG: SnoaL-like domain-containing protein [Hyphomicrobiales bacterium]
MSVEQLSEITHKLVAYCRDHKEEECLNALYSENAISVEAAIMPGKDSPETVGLGGIRGKHEWWNNTMEVHSHSADGPFLHGTDRFGVIFEFDATDKENQERMAMKELAIYTVEKGKIIREEFFYTM